MSTTSAQPDPTSITEPETPTIPVEGECEHCHRTRPLFAYEPDHNMHLGALAFTCRWCTRDKQPMLCARCWSTERELEEGDDALAEEAETWAQICAASDRYARRNAEAGAR